MWPFGAVCFIGYAMGVPALFLWRLWLHRDVLHLPGPQWQLGFLYGDYKHKFWPARRMPLPCH